MDFKLNKSRETFHFNPPIHNEGSLMLKLSNLEVYKFIFNIIDENNKFELFELPDSKIGGISDEKVRDEIKKYLGISDITATD